MWELWAQDIILLLPCPHVQFQWAESPSAFCIIINIFDVIIENSEYDIKSFNYVAESCKLFVH